MTETDKAYIAGIIDGEGSIMLLKFHNTQLPSPCISVTSTTRELLDYLKLTIVSGTIKSKKNYDIINHRDCFTYVLKYDSALKLLEAIEPYLVIIAKKERAKLILNEYKKLTLRNGKYTSEQLKLKEDFYNNFMKLK